MGFTKILRENFFSRKISPSFAVFASLAFPGMGGAFGPWGVIQFPGGGAKGAGAPGGGPAGTRWLANTILIHIHCVLVVFCPFFGQIFHPVVSFEIFFLSS